MNPYPQEAFSHEQSDVLNHIQCKDLAGQSGANIGSHQYSHYLVKSHCFCINQYMVMLMTVKEKSRSRVIPSPVKIPVNTLLENRSRTFQFAAG